MTYIFPPDRSLLMCRFGLADKKGVNALNKTTTNIVPTENEANTKDTPLYKAVEKGDLKAVKCLLANGADVNTKNIFGNTPLHKAVSRGDSEAIKLLLASGADVNARDDDGNTPLYEATFWGCLKVAEVFLAEGTEDNAVRATDDMGEMLRHRSTFWSGLDAAEFLDLYGENISIKDDDENTPLHWTTCESHREAVELLFVSSADMNAGSDGDKPIDLTPLEGVIKTLKVLLTKGSDVNAKGAKDRTPLHWTTCESHLKAVELLLASDADVNAGSGRSGKGYTPLHIATLRGDTALMKLLLASGADAGVRGSSTRPPREGIRRW